MTTPAIDPALVALVHDAMSLVPDGAQPEPPPIEPAPGQARHDWLTDVAHARAAHDAIADLLAEHIAPAGPEVGSVDDRSIEVDAGTITARIYHPGGDGPHPALVFFHGGAWWLAGGPSGYRLTDGYCRRFCAGLGAVIINVDYRLAPEHPYPGQLEDAYAALRWTTDNAGNLAIDPASIGVMGASSGGNLAAAVCLLARERGGPSIRVQVLHSPALDLTLTSPSAQADLAFMTDAGAIRHLYATPVQWTEPLVSPLLAQSLAGLPPAVIVTGDHDPIRDDGRRYATRLRQAAVGVAAFTYPMMHSLALPETLDQMFADMIGGTAPLIGSGSTAPQSGVPG